MSQTTKGDVEMKNIIITIFVIGIVSTVVALTPITLNFSQDATVLYFEEYFTLFDQVDEYDDAKVGKVVDGDTIWAMIDLMYVKIRLIGLDTPETVHPSKPVEYFGKQASGFAKKVLNDKEIMLSYDWNKFDKYERLLAYVWLQVEYEESEEYVLFNLLSIVNGYGHAYLYFPFDETYMEIFKEAEIYARDNMIGLWDENKAIEEVEDTDVVEPIGQGNGEVEIAFINFNDNPEYIKIKNNGDESVNLVGWKITDEGEKHVYVFGNVELKPGYTIYLYSGPKASKNVWTRAYIWNNDGDIGFLYDSNGKLVDKYEY